MATPETKPTEAKKEDGAGEHINIRVVSQNGNEVYFKIKRHTNLKKLMEAYCKRQSILESSVRFAFDGNRVNPEDTPETLGMEDDDIIDALVQQVGGAC